MRSPLACDLERAYYGRDSDLLHRLMDRADTLAVAITLPLLGTDDYCGAWMQRAINAHFAGQPIPPFE